MKMNFSFWIKNFTLYPRSRKMSDKKPFIKKMNLFIWIAIPKVLYKWSTANNVLNYAMPNDSIVNSLNTYIKTVLRIFIPQTSLIIIFQKISNEIIDYCLCWKCNGLM